MTESVLARINNGRGIHDLTRYVAHLHFGLISRDGTSARCLGGHRNVIAIVRDNKRCRIIVNGRIPSMCTTIGTIKKLGNNNRIRTRSRNPGNAVFGRFVSVVSGVFRPVLKPLTTAKVLGNITTLLITTNVSAASKTCILVRTTNSKFFGFLPVFLTFATDGRFGVGDFATVTVTATVICPNVIGPTNISPLCALFTNDVFRSPVCVAFLNLPIVVVDCTSSIIPVLLTIFLNSGIRGILGGIVPSIIGLFVIPFAALLVIIPLAVLFIKPVSA